MTLALVELIVANAVFVGTHFLMSHPLRAGMVRVLGNAGQQAVYSLVSLASLVWVYFAFTAAPAGDLPGSGDMGWIIATALTLPALVLLAGSFVRNPAIVMPGAEANARAAPKGVFTITRHPMMWGIALWALSHIILHFSWRTTITATAMGVLALVGSRMQDAKKRQTMGDAWDQWEASTSYWPRISGFGKAGSFAWALGLILFVFLSWLHMPIGGIPAGIWLWF